MPTEQRLTDHLFIKVDGEDLPAQAMNDLLEVTVDSSLHLPDAFTLHLHDEDLGWVDEGPFVLGKEVEIAAQPEGGGSSRVLIKAEITAIEPEFGEGTLATLLVRGYDRSHRLHRGSHSAAYLQMTDSDIAARVAQEAGLRPQVDATSEVYEHVLQHNQSHMAFLTERARRIGYEVYLEDRTLHFQSPPSGGDALELEWGRQLRSFRPRQSVLEQVDEVIVKGWDPSTRQTITGQAGRGSAEPQTGQGDSGAGTASAAFGSARRVVVDQPVTTQAEADSLAQALCDELSGAHIEAEGWCYGLPELRAGRQVRITSVGRRFSGSYLVTSATHIYRAGSGYTTSFAIHGRRNETILALLGTAGKDGGTTPAPVIGIVTNNDDPKGWGRIKVRFPWISDDVESAWARVTGVGAGPDRGLYWLPEINDEVLLAFEQGDWNRPIVLGGLWNGQDSPPIPNHEALENGAVHRRTLVTRAGHRLTLTDGADEGVVLETAGGHRLTLADQDQQVVVETSGGLVLTLDDGQRKVTLESTGDLALKAGANLTIEATANLELKGQMFSLQGSAKGEVDGGGMLDVKGGMVKIN
ncbi:MAG: VgrG-related protein [Anaerolineae bacterium]